MNRSFKLAVVVALALGSAPALALQLGQIQVKSALDRPLVAEIPLHPDYPGEADHLKVTLASAAAFARAGINRAALKVPLTFTVVTEADGQKAIRVTSTQPVREPYLDFLVEVTWPKGKMLREYVVLLNPLSATPAPAPIPMPHKAAAPAARQPSVAKTQPAKLPSPPVAPISQSGSTSEGVYGPVARGDTLSHIAIANAISGVSYQQMLIALKAANPKAFFRNNVNDLKAGAILRIPTRVEAEAVTRSAAIAAVRQQNEAWRSAHHAAKPTLVAGTGGSSAPLTGSGKGATGDDHLHLVPPSAGQASAGAAGGSRQATVSELRQDLARSKESLTSQKLASANLASRVSALEQIADKNKRLLGLKNAEIAELQQKLAAARKAAHLPPAPAAQTVGAPVKAAGKAAVAAAPTVAAAASAGLPATVASAGNQAAPVAAASTAEHTSAMAATPAHAKPVTARKTKSGAAQAMPRHESAVSAPWYEQLWARVVLIVIIVLLIIWLLLSRRKQPVDKKAKTPKTKKPKKAGKTSVADHFGESPFGHAADAGTAGAEAVAGMAPAGEDGEDELLAQLANHPDNIGLHLELASLYFARGDANQFEGAAEAMHAYVDDENDPEWQEVVAMGHELAPDHPLFAHVAPFHEEHAFDAPAMPSTETDMHELDDEAWHATTTHAPSQAEHDFGVEPDRSGTWHAEHESEHAGTGLPDESEFDALPSMSHDEREHPHQSTPKEPAHSEATLDLISGFDAEHLSVDLDAGGFSDDPVDTKLDLARAYMDMGDHVGARAMLTEALHEGSAKQQEAAQKLLDELRD